MARYCPSSCRQTTGHMGHALEMHNGPFKSDYLVLSFCLLWLPNFNSFPVIRLVYIPCLSKHEKKRKMHRITLYQLNKLFTVNKIMFKEHWVCPMLTLALFNIFKSKYIWATTLTFQGHVMLPVTWPYDTPGAISYRCFIVPESVSQILKCSRKRATSILGSTILTFLGHVTSLVTWPIILPYLDPKT